MGTDVGEAGHTLPNPRSFKVHRKMCVELLKLVDRISRIFPDIEAARPRCSSGIQSLCLLNNAMDKAKLLLQYCSESSKLYLAVTGDAVLLRCQKARKSLEQSLGQVKSIVPVMLAAEISQIIDYLACVTFVLDSAEEEAGKVVRELLQQGASTSNSMENSEMRALQFAAARLNITSSKAIVIEKRSIKKLVEKVGPSEQTKKMILRYLLYLLKKYENCIVGEQMENAYTYIEGPVATENYSNDSLHTHYVEPDQYMNYDQYRTHNSESDKMPEEYKCPISSRIMYDPVIIASGVTYERVWVQKWFDEGNDVCPKTKKKLVHTSLTPNVAMKDLISKWCRINGVTIPDPSQQDFRSWEISSTSIRSFGSSMNDLHLPVDLSSMSLGSLDTSHSSDSLHARGTRSLHLTTMKSKTNENSHSHPPTVHLHDTDLIVLSELSDRDWDSQFQAIEDLKNRLKCNCQVSCSVSSDNFIKPLNRFLNKGYELRDVKALRAGTRLLMEFVKVCGEGLTNLSEDTFSILASLLDFEVLGEALSIIEELSLYQHSKSAITSSVLTSILKILDSENREFQQQAIRIMYNLSSLGESCSRMVSLECIPKLLPFFQDSALINHCVCILENLCDTEEGRVSVSQTKGCLASVADILETGGDEEQEHALAVLLSLCSQREAYCHLVMDEGVIPSLVSISVNGSEKGKVSALEMLRLLRDVEYVENERRGENERRAAAPNAESSQDSNNHPQEKKPPKKPGFLKKMMKLNSR